jgi:hypothetical protein
VNSLEFTVGDRRWRADLRQGVDLSVPLDFDGPQPAFFTDRRATSSPLESGGFTGRVATGASCNCATLTLAPHCHGTHTECVGHVTRDDAHLGTRTPVPPALALLVTLQPASCSEASATAASDAGASGPFEVSDLRIERGMLEASAAAWLEQAWTALIVRTLPNDAAKRYRRYSGPAPAPYFTVAAMQWVVERGVTSLVVDLPSLDRADDGGALAVHRAYWGLPAGATDARAAQRDAALVTELAYVPDTLRDGLYLLDLQVAPFVTDAAPSRPVVYPLLGPEPVP